MGSQQKLHSPDKRNHAMEFPPLNWRDRYSTRFSESQETSGFLFDVKNATSFMGVFCFYIQNLNVSAGDARGVPRP